MFMCYKHWKMVPRAVQQAIWAEYVPGQEITKTPSNEYLNVVTRAIALVAAKEGIFPKAAA